MLNKHIAAIAFAAIVLAGVLIALHEINGQGNGGEALGGAVLGAEAPNATFTLLNGSTESLSRYSGKTMLLWFVSTWCGTCAQGNEALDANMKFFEEKNVTVIEVETYNNLDYSGPGMNSFVSEYAPGAYANASITIGYSSYGMMQAYDSRGYPDIYYLIARNGTIVYISGSPGATMDSLEAEIGAL